MSKKHSGNFSRGLAIMDFILKGDGHSILEASEKFKIDRSTVENDLNHVGKEIFHGNQKNAEKLQEKYKKMRKILSAISNDSKSKTQKAVSN